MQNKKIILSTIFIVSSIFVYGQCSTCVNTNNSINSSGNNTFATSPAQGYYWEICEGNASISGSKTSPTVTVVNTGDADYKIKVSRFSNGTCIDACATVCPDPTNWIINNCDGTFTANTAQGYYWEIFEGNASIVGSNTNQTVQVSISGILGNFKISVSHFTNGECYDACETLINFQPAQGCTDPNACNFDPTVCSDNGSCFYQPCNPGCTDRCAPNYEPGADADDGSCQSRPVCNADICNGDLQIWNEFLCICEVAISQVLGCIDSCAPNYNPNANCDDGSCQSCCVDDLTINSNSPFQNLYESANTITTQGTVIIQSNQQVEYNSNEVILNQGFGIEAGADFNIRNVGCN